MTGWEHAYRRLRVLGAGILNRRCRYARTMLLAVSVCFAVFASDCALAQPIPTKSSNLAAEAAKAPAAPPPAAKPASADQPPPTPTTPSPATPAASEGPQRAVPALLPGEVGPEIYLLPDRNGKLLAVPGFQYEDFIELYRLKHQLADVADEPQFVLSHAEISGKVTDDTAAFMVSLTIEVNSTGWVKIPLGFSGAIIERQPEFAEGGEGFLEFLPTAAPLPAARAQPTPQAIGGQAAGYLLWIKGDGKRTWRIKFPVVTRVLAVGGESLLRLDAPLASIAEFMLEIPLRDPVVRVSDGMTLRKVSEAAQGATISALGMHGLQEVAWRAAGGPAISTPTKLEASGRIFAQIDGRSVTYEALLTIRGLGGEFDGFRVRLPAGSQLISEKMAGMTIAPVPNQADGKPSDVVEVKLDNRTAGPIEVRLMAERPRAADNVDEPLELAGFEVLEAARQWGYLGVQVVGDWQVIWGESHGLRQVENRLEGKSADELLAEFEYASQPCSLSVRVSPRRTRVSVQPQYLLQVLPRETRLTAELRYTIRGAKVRELLVEMPGWEIEEIGPPNVVNVEAAAIDDATKFSIPLAQPANGDLVLTIKARRPLPPEIVVNTSQTLELEIPRPQAEVVSPAAVIVQAADNVELTPSSGSIVGLTLRSGRPPLAIAGMQQDPLYYQADGPVARFVSDFKVNPQRIQVTAETRVDIDEQRLQVDQQLRYDVQFEPAEKLTLLVPRSIALENVAVSLDRVRLATALANETIPSDPPDRAKVTVALGAARIGRFDLAVTYELPQERLPAAATVPVVVPLVLPPEKQLKEQRVLIRGQAGIAILPRKSEWKADERSRTLVERQEGLRLVTTESVDRVELALTLQERTEAATLIERAWIQTWLTEQGRQDRVLWRIVTDERKLRVRLPAETSPVGVQVTINGLPQEVAVDAEGEISFSLPVSSGQNQHLLELRYHVPSSAADSLANLAPPEIVPTAWVRRLYWELILPGQEHLLSEPTGFVNESHWVWKSGCWSRQPLLKGSQLADWMGVAAAESPIPAGANVYLLSGVGDIPTLKLWKARRSHLVFVASLVALLVGLAVIHFSFVRQPIVLFLLAATIAIGGFVALDLTVLLLQAGALGLVLALVALLLHRLSQSELAVKRAATPPAPDSKAVVVPGDRSATDLYYRAPSSSGISTATAPMVLPGGSAEPSS